MESILKDIELANKYGFPIPLASLLLVLGFWAVFKTNWPVREKYYYDLLAALGKWKNSLSDRLDYYMEPGSEYRDDSISIMPGFKMLSVKGREASSAVRDQLLVARFFLSEDIVAQLDELISDHWLISEMDAVCTQDYLEKTIKIVERSYDAVFAAAKRDLKKNRYITLVNKFLPK